MFSNLFNILNRKMNFLSFVLMFRKFYKSIHANKKLIIIPNRTFLVRFGDISGEFGRAMVRILARRSRAKIPMVRPNELDILPKRTKKGAIRYLPYPNSS